MFGVRPLKPVSSHTAPYSGTSAKPKPNMPTVASDSRRKWLRDPFTASFIRAAPAPTRTRPGIRARARHAPAPAGCCGGGVPAPGPGSRRGSRPSRIHLVTVERVGVVVHGGHFALIE